MDRIDRALLSHLQQDGRLTAAELGDRVGLSASATHRRVKALEVDGLIDHYTAILSPRATGWQSTVFVAVSVENQKRETLEKFERAVADCPEVLDCYLMSGESDYLLKVAVRDSDKYERIHSDVLSSLPGVRRVVSSFAIRTVFRRPGPPLKG
jgi:Lrp/AsnC family transcriptional regulator, leucine-responsive regulatory protein